MEKSVATRSRRVKIPTRYVREIQSGIGTADNRPGKPNLPAGMQIPEPIPQIEGETEDNGQMERAMAAAVSKIEAIDPQSLEEARRRPDWPKWVIAIQEELNTLKKAGTWKIVERPKERNVVKISGYSEYQKKLSWKGQTVQSKAHCKGLYPSVWC